MLNLQIEHAACFKDAQKHFTQTVISPWVLIHFFGYNYLKIPKHRIELIKPKHFLFLGVQDDSFTFDASTPRENWVVFLSKSVFQHSNRRSFVKVKYNDDYIDIPMIIPISGELVPVIRHELINMLELLKSPVPINKFKASLCLSTILYQTIEQQISQTASTAEEKLKHLIDADKHFDYNLSGLCNICSYSQDHLRVLFKKRYNISPLHYRNQLRMVKAMELISNSNMLIKEITFQTGFKHVSHFSALYLKTFGYYPMEGIKRFRH